MRGRSGKRVAGPGCGAQTSRSTPASLPNLRLQPSITHVAGTLICSSRFLARISSCRVTLRSPGTKRSACIGKKTCLHLKASQIQRARISSPARRVNCSRFPETRFINYTHISGDMQYIMYVSHLLGFDSRSRESDGGDTARTPVGSRRGGRSRPRRLSFHLKCKLVEEFQPAKWLMINGV